MMETRTIMVAPNGARLQPSQHNAVPIDTPSLIDCLQACADAGATMAHIHARDESGAHSLDPALNRHLYHNVQDAVGDRMVIQLTTEAVGRYRPSEQIALVKTVEPEAVSVALRELAPDPIDTKEASAFFAWLHQRGIYTQFILYHPQDIERYRQLRHSGVIPSRGHHLLFVAGRDKSPPFGNPEDIVAMWQALVDKSNVSWSACAFGHNEIRCLTTAALLGGDVRVGFENNTQRLDQSQAMDNASQITDLRNTLEKLGYCTKPVQALRQTMTQSF
ncbi:3-keto-5-aminohexanoate cleavage protein [Salinivibrio sp. ES.052]|uniref:3-keto-5-aminohexanoate cleavage protein n=1 Tax=Salinivibrio sp. ES.052 TaxID=1882823 RepID=UPI000926A489|nr:3-keto-5-aminohexanoate cleavage protein [Salinivibrio sp. ES.052]SIO01710.1 Uncharacterized conserved protein, DUF849 family [Salinivibrio sp. ES.052]